MIGTIGYNSWNFYNGRAEICYELMPEYWRRGIMTKCLTNALSLGFKKMHLHRIEAKCMVHNIASQGILNKMGFKREGILRHYRVIRGKPTDVCLYALLREEFAIL